MYQQIIVIGNVGGNPQMNYTATGKPVCNLSVATTQRWKTGDDAKEKTTWFKVTAWGPLAETCHQYVTKGMQVMVTGEVEVQAYMGSDGQPKASLVVTAREVRFLGSRNQGDSTSRPNSPIFSPNDTTNDDEEVPF